MVHPDTGEIIPYPFRMSFFAPANIPIAVGMVLFGQSVSCSSASASDFTPALMALQTASQLFWQLANQLYNGSVNFANRNATVEVSDAEAATSLAAASAIACGMAFFMGKGAKRIAANPKYSPGVKSAVTRVSYLQPLPHCAPHAPPCLIAVGPPHCSGGSRRLQRACHALQGGPGGH